MGKKADDGADGLHDDALRECREQNSPMVRCRRPPSVSDADAATLINSSRVVAFGRCRPVAPHNTGNRAPWWQET